MGLKRVIESHKESFEIGENCADSIRIMQLDEKLCRVKHSLAESTRLTVLYNITYSHTESHRCVSNHNEFFTLSVLLHQYVNFSMKKVV